MHCSQYFGSLLTLLSITLMSEKAYGQLADSPWPDYGGGLTNTHVANSIGPSNPQIRWAYDIVNKQVGEQSYATSQPVLGPDGTIFFVIPQGGLDQNVLALNPDGTTKWVVYGRVLTRPSGWAAIDAEGQLLYLRGSNGSASSRLTALDSSNGTQLWIGPPLQTPYETGPTVGNDGTIYVTDNQKTFQSLTPTGQLNWAATAGGPFVNPAIDSNGTIFAGGRSLSAINHGGEVLWSIASQNQPIYDRIRYFVSPAIDQHDHIYVGTTTSLSDPGYFLAVDASGNQLWRRDDVSGAAAIGTNGTIYAGWQGILHAMSPLDGHDLWTYNTGLINSNGAEGVTIDLLGDIYLSTIDGRVLSLTPQGQLRWEINLVPDATENVYLTAPVIGANGDLYVGGGYSKQIYAIQNIPEVSSLFLAAISFASVVRMSTRKKRLINC